MMNEELATFARKYLKENLPKCTEGERHVFKQMYYPQHTDRSIDEAIEKMPDEKLECCFCPGRVPCATGGYRDAYVRFLSGDGFSL